jgi:hypothetical protein
MHTDRAIFKRTYLSEYYELEAQIEVCLSPSSMLPVVGTCPWNCPSRLRAFVRNGDSQVTAGQVVAEVVLRVALLRSVRPARCRVGTGGAYACEAKLHCWYITIYESTRCRRRSRCCHSRCRRGLSDQRGKGGQSQQAPHTTYHGILIQNTMRKSWFNSFDRCMGL